MAASQLYPEDLNPFGSDDEESSDVDPKKQSLQNKQDDYPEYLSPFEDETNNALESSIAVDDYDNSLNPFGDEEDTRKTNDAHLVGGNSTSKEIQFNDANPFDEEEISEQRDELGTNPQDDSINPLAKSFTPQPESLDPPPVPLPRTKSLLKKEKAQKIKQQQDPKPVPSVDANNITTSILSTTSSTSSSSITTGPNLTTSVTTVNSDSFQRKKNKRNAPPVPINFKRQVFGSLDAIEEELNGIGDDLAEIEKEYNLCQNELKATHQVDDAKFAKSRQEFSDLIIRKNSIVRRQKELMYKKRELKLDQIHSDIEYELRMIGNKQLSHKTTEDEIRERELLKKLVEIVEEKSDIVENLSRDTSCDSQDIEEALRRLNIFCKSAEDPEAPSSGKEDSPDMPVKKNNCDKSSAVIGIKMSKIATLLPKGSTLKGTMKLKRKRLFKKSVPRPVEKSS